MRGLPAHLFSGLFLTGLAAPLAAQPLDPATEVRLKAAEARATTSAVQVDWAGADAARRSVPTTPQARAALEGARLPVLLPASRAAKARVLTGPGWVAVNVDGDGVRLSLHAHGTAHRRPELAGEQKALGFGDGRPRVARIHGIVSLAFERFGVAYVLDVECAAPEADARCADGLFAMTVFDDLVVAGGQP